MQTWELFSILSGVAISLKTLQRRSKDSYCEVDVARMKEDLALCQRVVSAVADNLGSPLAFRAMITVLGQELGACVGLVYGLKRDGRFRLVDFFGVDRPTANALEGLDPRDFLSPSDFSAGNVSVRSDLNPLLAAWEGPQATLSSAFFIPVSRSRLLVGCLLVGFLHDQRENPFGRTLSRAAAFATFHLISEEPGLVLGSQ